MSGSVRAGIVTVVLCLLAVAPPATATTPEERTAELLTKLMRTGRKVIAAPPRGEAKLTAERFTSLVVADFKKATSIDLQGPEAREHTLLTALLQAERATVEDARGAVPSPAAFVRATTEKFTARTGIIFRFTPAEQRQERVRPDEFEQRVFSLISQPTYPKGKPYQEVVRANGKKTFRIMFPEYVTKSCLACYGEPGGDRNGAGRREGALAGALSLIFPDQASGAGRSDLPIR